MKQLCSLMKHLVTMGMANVGGIPLWFVLLYGGSFIAAGLAIAFGNTDAAKLMWSTPAMLMMLWGYSIASSVLFWGGKGLPCKEQKRR